MIVKLIFRLIVFSYTKIKQCIIYTNGRKPVGRGPIVGLLAKFIGLRNAFCNKVWAASVIFLV